MCGSTTTAAQTKQPNILLVIDKSHSMTDTPAGFTSDKWTAMKTALTAAIDAVKGQISLGLELYPFQASASTPIPIPCSDALCCQLPADGAAIEVPIELGTSSVPKIINALNATAPSGGTPTAAALQRAYEYYTVGAGAALQGEKYVLLATDGAPNCNSSLTCTGTTCVPNIDMTCTVANCCTGPNGSINCLDDMAAVQQITNLKAVNVPTFVVGIPGTQNFKTVLNNMAVAGGVPATGATSFYDVPPSGGVQGLTDTFKQITTSLVRSCDIQLQDAPMAANLVNVAIDCTVVPQGSDATAGWVLTGTTITLRGTTCDYVQTTGVMRIDVIVGCGTVG
jgi:hypothetical protein